jgi:hypothetical protein
MVKVVTACSMIDQHQFGLLMFLKYIDNNGTLDWPLCRSMMKLSDDINRNRRRQLDHDAEKLQNILKSIESIESLDSIKKKYENGNLHDKAMAYIVKRVRPLPGIHNDVVPKDLIYQTMAEFVRIGELDKMLTYLNKLEIFSSTAGQDDINRVRMWESTISKLGFYGEWRAVLALMEQLKSYRYYEWNDKIWLDLQSEAYISMIRSNQLQRSKALLKDMIANPNHVLSKADILKIIVSKIQNYDHVYISILINDIVEVDGKLDNEYKMILESSINNLNNSNLNLSDSNISETVKTLQQLIR